MVLPLILKLTENLLHDATRTKNILHSRLLLVRSRDEMSTSNKYEVQSDRLMEASISGQCMLRLLEGPWAARCG